MNDQVDLDEPVDDKAEKVRRYATWMSSIFLRNEQRFYHVDAPNTPLSRRDLEQAFINIVTKREPHAGLSAEILRSVCDVAIERKHSDRARSIPVWGKTMACYPGNKSRITWLDTGVVELNTWREPAYRSVEPDPKEDALEPFKQYFSWVFPRPQERMMVLSWLSWCLRNEDKKPAWALLLYSRQKGTGKSTFCEIARKLFGEENTATQNNVDKLASRFNATPLINKLIISEEFSLRPDSSQSNAIKTYITDPVVLSERKGKEAERLPLRSIFVFTTNHLPTWLEEGERRYYMVETDHDGHAAGPKSKEFNNVIRSVKEALSNPATLNAFYQHLMGAKLLETFDPYSLNTEVHGTEIMKRVAGASRQTHEHELEEHLAALGQPVQTNAAVKKYVMTEFKVSGNSTRHLMMAIGWTQHLVKWGGVDYARAIWAAKDYHVVDGRVIGPNGYNKPVEEVLLKDVQL